MKNKIALKILLILVAAIFLLAACGAEDNSAVAVNDSAQSVAVSTQTLTGVVTHGMPSLAIETSTGSVEFDATAADVFGSVAVGDIVDVVATGDVAHLVTSRNEDKLSIEINGSITELTQDSISVLSGSDIITFSLHSADILSTLPLAIGDVVKLTAVEDTAAIIEVLQSSGGVLRGEAVEIAQDILIVSTQDGGYFPFDVSQVALPEFGVGDKLAVGYVGTLSGEFSATTVVTELAAQVESGTIEGHVTDYIGAEFMLRTADGEQFTFNRQSDNSYSNNILSVGDLVRVDYTAEQSGDLFADNITILVYSAGDVASIVGVLTHFEQGTLTIRTVNSNKFVYSHNDATAFYTDENAVPQIGDIVTVEYRTLSASTRPCFALYVEGVNPTTMTVDGSVLHITSDTLSVSTSSGDVQLLKNGALLSAAALVRPGDTVSVWALDRPSGSAQAMEIIVEQSAEPPEPTPLEFDGSGVVTGEVAYMGDMYVVRDDSDRLYALDVTSATLPDDLEVGDRVIVQYVGNSLRLMEAILITVE